MLKNPLRLATPEEVEFFSGHRSGDLSSLFHAFQEGNINPNHLEAMLKVADDVSNLADKVIGWTETEWIRQESGLLTPDSNISFESINMTINPHSKKGRRLFNVFKTTAGANGLAMLSRPLPVSWGLEHISDRFKQRSPEDFDYASLFFQKVLGLSILMARIIEQTNDWEYQSRVPFILPAKRGMYLGWAELVGNGKDESGNRISLTAAKDEQTLGLKEYDWFPEVKMMVNTYIGPEQMRPQQKQLRYALMKLMEGRLGSSFFYELNSYSFVKDDERFDIPVITDDYETAFLKVAEIMESPLWAQNVKMPQKGRGPRYHNY